jgi:hypothetical protein
MPMKKNISFICFEVIEEGQKKKILFFSCFQVENKVANVNKISCLHPFVNPFTFLCF